MSRGRKFTIVMVLALTLVLGLGSAIMAWEVYQTDFTSSFTHSYYSGLNCQYSVGGLLGNGWNEASQSISSAEYSLVAAQFYSLNGTIQPEVSHYDGGYEGRVYSGRCAGQTKNAVQLMFYGDVRRNGNIIDDLRMYYH